MYGLWYTILSNIFRLVTNQCSNKIDIDIDIDIDNDNDIDDDDYDYDYDYDPFIVVKDIYICIYICVCVWKTTRRKRINIAFSSSLYFVNEYDLFYL
jgi:hypothetical protein